MKLEELSALELGNLVNTKDISPVEVIDYFEGQVTAKNESLNAFTYTRFDEAREVAKEQEAKLLKGENIGCLAGVPVALKDFLPSKTGWQASHGGVRSLITVDEDDSVFTRSVESQGAIVIGKTNAPSFGFRGLTDNYMYGPTSTPFKLGYNSGGSSGGSCAAVGGLMVPLAECGDAGGSGRIPAAWCGVFGFKPSAGLVPSICRPDAWTATHPYCCPGPAARTVADAAAVICNMQGYDPRDPISVPLDPIKFLEPSSIKSLRIGVTYDFGVFPQPQDEIVNAIDECAKILSSTGAVVEHVTFDATGYTRRELELAWLQGICIDTAIDMELWKQQGFDLDKNYHDDLPEEFFQFNRLAINSNMLDYRKFHDIRTSILDSQLSVFKDYDIVIAPVAGCLSVPNAKNGDTRGPKEINGKQVDDLIGFAYTYLQNMTGYPAASIPFGLSTDHLPVGVQVVGRRYRDKDVFDVAYALESLHPWYNLYKEIEV